MHENHIDQPSLPQARRSKCQTRLKKKRENKELGKNQQKSPRSETNKATQNKASIFLLIDLWEFFFEILGRGVEKKKNKISEIDQSIKK